MSAAISGSQAGIRHSIIQDTHLAFSGSGLRGKDARDATGGCLIWLFLARTEPQTVGTAVCGACAPGACFSMNSCSTLYEHRAE